MWSRAYLKNILLGIIVVLVIFSLGLSHDADAVSATINDEASCGSVGGTSETLDSIFYCILNSDQTISSGEKWFIPTATHLKISEGVTLTIAGGGILETQFGTSTSSSSYTHGTIWNSGIIENNGVIEQNGKMWQSGTINNYELINIRTGGDIVNYSIINNHDIFHIFGFLHSEPGSSVTNSGTFTNEGRFYLQGALNNSGVFNNYREFYNYQPYEHESSAGTINNSGTFTNDPRGYTGNSHFLGIVLGSYTNPGTFNNSGILINYGALDSQYGSIINDCDGFLYGTEIPTAGNPVTHTCTPPNLNISEKFNSSNNPAISNQLGNPIGDVIIIPGVGAYINYENGSVYANPTIGTHAVINPIYDKWKSMNFEHSYLGWPISDTTFSNGDSYNNFEGGVICHNAGQSNAAAYPSRQGPSACEIKIATGTASPFDASTGAYDITRNLAAQDNGALPSTSPSTISGYPLIHAARFLNDGIYGNGKSWISDASNSYIITDFGKVHTIDTVQFGRDRLGQYDDRDPGQFFIDAKINGVFTRIVDSSSLGFSGNISGAETIQVQ